jgi:hypothetical protein
VPAYDKYGRGNQFSWPLFSQNWHSSVYPTAPAGLIFTGDSENHYGKALTAAHWATFSPRLGIVWDPNGDGKQTIRASFGLMHDTTELFYPERWTTNAPYVSSLTLTSGQFSDPFKSYVSPSGKTGDPFPGAAVFPSGGAYISVPGNLKVTYMMQWNLSYQRQIAKDWMVTANYLGNASRHIWGSTDINYAVPTAGATTGNTNARRLTALQNPVGGAYYGNIQQSDDGANAEYHGLLLKAEKRMARNFALHTTYSWSHCVSSWDFAGELAGVIYQNPQNRKTGERGNCGYDHRHSFTVSLVALSRGFGNGAASLITKDWQISPIISLFTGNPIQVTDGKDISLSGQGLDRPTVVLPDQVYGSPKAVSAYLNPAAFQCAGSNAACTVFSGQFGNLGRNSLYGPGQRNFDIAVSRQFRFHERFKMEFRSDFFNILNHGNWSGIGTTVSSGTTFGQVTSFGSPRLIQLAMKFYF